MRFKLSCLGVIVSFCAFGQDLIGLSIQLEHITGTSFSVRVDTYVNEPTAVFRPFILVDYGLFVDTVFFDDTIYPSDLDRNDIYLGDVNFFAPGLFNVTVDLGTRYPNILNFVDAGSTAIRLESAISFTPTGGDNSTPRPLNSSTNVTMDQGAFTYDPAFFDQEGDSLSFEMIQCDGGGYSIPGGAVLDSNLGILSINSVAPGSYSFCVQIEEWRIVSGDPLYLGTTELEYALFLDPTIGIMENLSPQPFIFENPVHNELRIVNGAVNATYDIMTVSGMRMDHVAKASGNVIDISEMSSGCYVLIENGLNGEVTRISRFIKDRVLFLKYILDQLLGSTDSYSKCGSAESTAGLNQPPV